METPLRAAREKRGMTLKQVADACGIDVSHYRRVELAEAGVSPEKAEVLARFFGHEVSEMQILYPKRYMAQPADEPVAAV